MHTCSSCSLCTTCLSASSKLCKNRCGWTWGVLRCLEMSWDMINWSLAFCFDSPQKAFCRPRRHPQAYGSAMGEVVRTRWTQCILLCSCIRCLRLSFPHFIDGQHGQHGRPFQSVSPCLTLHSQRWQFPAAEVLWQLTISHLATWQKTEQKHGEVLDVLGSAKGNHVFGMSLTRQLQQHTLISEDDMPPEMEVFAFDLRMVWNSWEISDDRWLAGSCHWCVSGISCRTLSAWCRARGQKSIDYTLTILTWRGLRFGPLYRALCQRSRIFAVAKDRHGTGLTKATPATPKW